MTTSFPVGTGTASQSDGDVIATGTVLIVQTSLTAQVSFILQFHVAVQGIFILEFAGQVSFILEFAGQVSFILELAVQVSFIFELAVQLSFILELAGQVRFILEFAGQVSFFLLSYSTTEFDFLVLLNK